MPIKQAKEGYILTDGINYAETFDLPEHIDITRYYEITKEEHQKIINEINGIE